MTARRPDLLTMIHELTQPTHHRQPYMRKRKPRYHTTHNPPLLAQLDQALIPPGHSEGISGGARSRPAANIDAIDTASRIHTQAHAWLDTIGADTAGNTIDLVHRLGPTAITQGHCHQPKPRNGCCIQHDIRRWWTWARITTGWDLPPWQPNNTCPLCGTRGTIRIRAAEKLATCINDECRATWDEATFGLLAEHIRAENGEAQAAG